MKFAMQRSAAPTNKTNAAGIASFVVVIIVWAAKQWGQVDIPAEVAAAATGIIAYLAAYITPPAQRDQIDKPK